MKNLCRIACLLALLLCSCRQKNDVVVLQPEFMEVSKTISNNTVNAFVQDHFGYVWIATDRGLNKYNGYDFHCYYHNSNPVSLRDNQVKSLFSDAEGCLWVGTVNGICHYTKEDNFATVPLSGQNPYITRIMQTPKGKIVAFSRTSIEVFDKTQNDTRFSVAVTLNNSFINICMMDAQGLVWIINQESMNWYDLDNNTHGEPIELTNFVYHAYLQDNSIIWLCSMDGNVRLFDTRTKTFSGSDDKIKNLHGGIKNIFTYNEQSLLIYTNELESYIYTPSTGTIIASTDNHFPITLPDAELSVTMFDKQSNLWIGTLDQGFTVRYAYKKQFNSNSYLTSQFDKKSVIGMAQTPDNNVVITTNHHGIYIWNQERDEVHQAIVNKSVKSFRPERIFVDSQGKIYITYFFWVVRYTLKNYTLNVDMAYWMPCGQCYDMCEDRYGRIWVGAYSNNVYILGRNDNSVTPVKIVPDDRRSFVPEVICLNDGTMAAIALNYGLVILNPDNNKTKIIPIDTLLNDGVFIPTALTADSYGKLWIGTRGQGLLQYDIASEMMRTIDSGGCKEIMEIREDSFGNIWISTMNGLMRYDRTVDKFITYFASEGTGGDIYNESAGLVTSNGTMLFGGTHGLTVFNPIDVPSRRKVTLAFEDITINNKIQHAYDSDALAYHVTESKSVVLRQKRDVNVGISFVAIDYNEFPSLHYDYRLDGFEDNWIDARGNRKAFYSNLPAGKYRFCVRVWNNDYSYMVAEDAMTLTVKPPFLLSPIMKWGVYPLLTLALLIAAVWLAKRIDDQKKEVAAANLEREREQRTNDMNMHYFVNISHEMRTPLTMIKGPLDLLVDDNGMGEENRKLLTIIIRNVNRLLRFLNQMMDIGKLDDDTLRLSVGYYDAVTVTNRMLDVFLINAHEKNIQFVTHGLNDSFISLFNDDYLEKIISNLMSNAIKFTPEGGKIDFCFNVISREEAMREFNLTEYDKASEFMCFSIADTGCGIPADKLENVFLRYYQVEQSNGKFNYGTGIGLYYSRRLVELHHGHIKAENRTDVQGARFTFIIPVGEDVYAEDLRTAEQERQRQKSPNIEIQESSAMMSEQNCHSVLIVEDDTELAHLLKMIFSRKYKVVNRFDADSALAAIEDIEPDIIISDIVMPGKIDGYGLCRAIKDNLSTCHIPIILLTAKTNIESQVEGMKAGADGYVMKPFDAPYLMAMVESQLANRDRLRSMLGTITHTEIIEDGKLSPYDKEFLDSLYELMEKELSNPELNITRMTDVLHIGRTKLYYKIKGLTGENPNTFFKTYKLNRAAQILAEGKSNISEVADITGFSTLSHFSVSFKKQFGLSPSDYLIQKKQSAQ